MLSAPADVTGRLRAWAGHDLVLSLAPPVLLGALAGHELRYNDAPPTTWLLVTALLAPLVWRRRAPVLVLVACLVVAAVLWADGTATVADAALLVALYTVAAHRPLPYAVAAVAVLELGVVAYAGRFAPTGSVGDAVVLLSGVVAAALFLGTTVRTKREYLASVEERARRLEHAREQEARLAAAAERARIAREMHDIVAHSLSVVTTLAQGAAASVDTDPRAAKDSMLQVAATGRGSLAEMRRLLGVLRADGEAPPHQPSPGIEALDPLLARVRATGLDVRLERRGDPADLGDAAQVTLYRVVQEALTNVLKHGRDVSAATVRLDLADDLVRFEIRDDGRAGPQATGGKGLVGMRERVEMYDGSLVAGPDPRRGWTVRGHLRLGP